MKIQTAIPKRDKEIISGKDHWTTIGWYGISLRVPPNWNLAVIGGDNKSGYLRVDDDEMPRVQVKWSETQKTVDLKRILQNYLKGLQKGAKKKKVKLEFEQGVPIVPKRRKRQKNILGFFWRADFKGYGAVWYCRSCARVVITQITGKLDEEFYHIASQILESLEDHPQKGWNTWALYDFSIKAPEEYKIDKHKLLTGYIDLSFLNGKKVLRVARWGIANVILKDHSLSEWFKGKEEKALSKKFKLQTTESMIKGHPGLEVEGYKKRLFDKLRRFLESLFRLKSPLWLKGILWHCPESNKIFFIQTVSDLQNSLLTQEVCASLNCH